MCILIYHHVSLTVYEKNTEYIDRQYLFSQLQDLVSFPATIILAGGLLIQVIRVCCFKVMFSWCSSVNNTYFTHT